MTVLDRLRWIVGLPLEGREPPFEVRAIERVPGFAELSPHGEGPCFLGCPACTGPGPVPKGALDRKAWRTRVPGWRPIPVDPAAPWYEGALRAGPPRRNGKTELGARILEGALLARDLVVCECTADCAPVVLGAAPGLGGGTTEGYLRRLSETRWLPCPLHPEPRP